MALTGTRWTVLSRLKIRCPKGRVGSSPTSGTRPERNFGQAGIIAELRALDRLSIYAFPSRCLPTDWRGRGGCIRECCAVGLNRSRQERDVGTWW